MKEITIHQLSIFTAVYAINARKWLRKRDFVLSKNNPFFSFLGCGKISNPCLWELFVLVINIEEPFCGNVNKLNIMIIIINTINILLLLLIIIIVIIITKRQIHLLSLILRRLIFTFQKSLAGSRISSCGNQIRFQIKTTSS